MSDAAPKCTRCGHEPCPGCVDWCDMIVPQIYCPGCDEIHGPAKGVDEGTSITCKHCGLVWTLELTHIESDLCCDGQCKWDQDQDAVEAWCAKQRGGK